MISGSTQLTLSVFNLYGLHVIPVMNWPRCVREKMFIVNCVKSFTVNLIDRFLYLFGLYIITVRLSVQSAV